MVSISAIPTSEAIKEKKIMSCITEILQKKGDHEFLPVELPGHVASVVIEGGGHYKGYEYLITFTDNGFRCGYVAISEDHPIHACQKEYPHNLSVHGGVTFFGESHLSDKILGHSCTDKWVGFDGGHAYDIRDLDKTMHYFPHLRPDRIRNIMEMNQIMRMSEGMRSDYPCELRTYEYMEHECMDLIDQLIVMKEAA
jgi:hypothetical protein